MDVLAPACLPGRRRPWQDLPSELLGLVLLRIPSHASRVRLRAVCRSWRAGARMQSPLLPWLALRDGTFVSLPDGEVHRRVLTPDDDVAHRVSTGSMLFLVHSHEGCSLMNPVSRESTAPRHINLERRLRTEPGNIRKVVVVSDQVTAVWTENNKNLTISVRRPHSSDLAWRWRPHSDAYPDYFLDIALVQEKLYVLATTRIGVGYGAVYPLRLYVVDVDKSVSIRCISTSPTNEVDHAWEAAGLFYYLVESGDRLLMVKQNRKLGQRVKQELFEVFEFEATDTSSGHKRWRKMDTLMGRALFLSDGCSQSLPAAAGDQCVGAQDDCIYFVREHDNCHRRMRCPHSGIYNMKERTVSPLPIDMTGPHVDGPLTATWFFPDET